MILLDTCILIFAAENKPIHSAAEQAIQAASDADELFVSPISAWEIGNVVSLNRLRLQVDPLTYFTQFLAKSRVSLCELGTDILISSSFLPGPIHKDPMDRIIVETARRNHLTIVTRDQKILAYGALGYVKTIAC